MDKNTKSGFTLIEMLIVIGTITLLVSLLSFIDISSLWRETFKSKVDSLAEVLQTVRIRAMNNIEEESQRVVLTPDDYDLVFDPSSPAEIVFEQLSGDADYEGDLILIDSESNATAIISINHEGRISW